MQPQQIAILDLQVLFVETHPAALAASQYNRATELHPAPPLQPIDTFSRISSAPATGKMRLPPRTFNIIDTPRETDNPEL
jgi:hypothetical protein